MMRRSLLWWFAVCLFSLLCGVVLGGSQLCGMTVAASACKSTRNWAYDNIARVNSSYDRASVLLQIANGNRSAGSGSPFGYFAEFLAAETAANAERLVIGRGGDLAKPGALNPGEFKFSWPPTGAAQTEWKVNSGLLRQEMGNLRPIRDASVGNSGGMYLNAERNLLQDRGWTFDANTSLWIPPAH